MNKCKIHYIKDNDFPKDMERVEFKIDISKIKNVDWENSVYTGYFNGANGVDRSKYWYFENNDSECHATKGIYTDEVIAWRYIYFCDMEEKLTCF